MIEETAIIIKREGEYAWVEKQRQSTCGSCSANKGCGTAVLGKVFEKRFVTVKARNQINAEVGAEVVIGLNESAMLKAAFLVYLLPLLIMITTAIFAEMVATMFQVELHDLSVAGLAIMGLLVTFKVVKRKMGNLANKSHYEPVIVRYAQSVHVNSL